MVGQGGRQYAQKVFPKPYKGELGIGILVQKCFLSLLKVREELFLYYHGDKERRIKDDTEKGEGVKRGERENIHNFI